MPRFYSDSACSAIAEWKTVRATSKVLCAALLGYSGTQKEGEDAKDYLYHFERAFDASLYCKRASDGRSAGFIFFRHCPLAVSNWLIVSLGLGSPASAQCVEAVRRFHLSLRL